MKTEKNKNRKMLYSLLIFLGLTLLVVVKIFKGIDRVQILRVLEEIDKKYIVLALGLALFSTLGEALNLKVLLKLLGYKTKLIKTIKYAFTGFFFSSITPSSTGGQPMQVYEMKKDGIEVSHSTIILLIELLSYQFVTISLGIFASILRFKDLESRLIKILILLGLAINLIAFVFIWLSVFRPKVVYKILDLLKFIINKFIQKQRGERWIASLEKTVEEYNSTANYIKQNKKELFKVLLVTYLQLISLFSTSYVIYKSLGGVNKGFLEIVTLQNLVYLGSTFIPVPGGVGVKERNFLLLYKGVYTKEILNISLVLSRGISFYLLLIITLVVLFIYKIREYYLTIDVKKELF